MNPFSILDYVFPLERNLVNKYLLSIYCVLSFWEVSVNRKDHDPCPRGFSLKVGFPQGAVLGFLSPILIYLHGFRQFFFFMTKTPTFLFLALGTSPDSRRTESPAHSTSPRGPRISVVDAVKCSLDVSPSCLRPSFPQLSVVLAAHSWDLHQKLPSAEESCLTPGKAIQWLAEAAKPWIKGCFSSGQLWRVIPVQMRGMQPLIWQIRSFLFLWGRKHKDWKLFTFTKNGQQRTLRSYPKLC